VPSSVRKNLVLPAQPNLVTFVHLSSLGPPCQSRTGSTRKEGYVLLFLSKSPAQPCSCSSMNRPTNPACLPSPTWNHIDRACPLQAPFRFRTMLLLFSMRRPRASRSLNPAIALLPNRCRLQPFNILQSGKNQRRASLRQRQIRLRPIAQVLMPSMRPSRRPNVERSLALATAVAGKRFDAMPLSTQSRLCASTANSMGSTVLGSVSLSLDLLTFHSLTCFQFLPITETRFKRKKESQEPELSSSAAPSSIPSYSAPPLVSGAPFAPAMPRVMPTLPPPPPPPPPLPSPTVSSMRAEPRFLGPTSMTHIMHSTSTFPVEHMESFDRRYVINFEARQSGDGFIKVFRHNEDPGVQAADPQTMPLGVQGELVEQLVNRFFDTHAPLFPVLSRADFIASSPLDPMLLYVICGISSLNRQVPSHVLRTFKAHIAGLFRRDDFGATSNLQTIQALLLYVWSLELEPRFGGSKSWNTLGMVGFSSLLLSNTPLSIASDRLFGWPKTLAFTAKSQTRGKGRPMPTILSCVEECGVVVSSQIAGCLLLYVVSLPTGVFCSLTRIFFSMACQRWSTSQTATVSCLLFTRFYPARVHRMSMFHTGHTSPTPPRSSSPSSSERF
jgi:hypothetical protein